MIHILHHPCDWLSCGHSYEFSGAGDPLACAHSICSSRFSSFAHLQICLRYNLTVYEHSCVPLTQYTHVLSVYALKMIIRLKRSQQIDRWVISHHVSLMYQPPYHAYPLHYSRRGNLMDGYDMCCKLQIRYSLIFGTSTSMQQHGVAFRL